MVVIREWRKEKENGIFLEGGMAGSLRVATIPSPITVGISHSSIPSELPENISVATSDRLDLFR